ncbi:MAG: DUF1702 family protein [Methylococcaceae bacterium]
MSQLRKQLFGIPRKEIRCERRGFDIVDTAITMRIETIGETFILGYHAALFDDHPHALEMTLNIVSPELREISPTIRTIGKPKSGFWQVC